MEVLAKLMGWIGSREARRVRAWRVVLLTVGFGLGPHVVFAQVSCTGNAETITIQMPPTIIVSSDSSSGRPLTPWITLPSSTNWFYCTGSGRRGTIFQPLSSLGNPIGNQAGPDGLWYTVWGTGVPGVGLQIVIAPRMEWLFSSNPYQDLGRYVAGRFPNPWVGDDTDFSKSGGVGGEAKIALVQTGRITAGGKVFGREVFEAASIANRTSISSNRKQFRLTETTIIVPSCKTPDVIVQMGSYKQAAFRGIGSTTTPVPFNVAVNGCAAGMSAIEYQFDPRPTVFDQRVGVMNLSGDSTAKGIGLQLMDSNGTPVKFGTPYTLSDYSTATGGSYVIRLKAAYYQTESTVTAGSAKAAATITLNYR